MDTSPGAAKLILSLLTQKAKNSYSLWQDYNNDPNKAQWDQSYISSRQGQQAADQLAQGGASRNSDGTWNVGPSRNSDGTWSVGGATVKFH